MSQKVGLSEYISLKTYDDYRSLINNNLTFELKRKCLEQGYEVSSDVLIREIGYLVVGDEGFVPVSKKEDAEIVELYATADAVSYNLMEKVPVANGSKARHILNMYRAIVRGKK